MSWREALARRISPVAMYTQDQLDSYAVRALGEQDLAELLEGQGHSPAFKLATTYACVRLIATSVASMPWVAKGFNAVSRAALERKPFRFVTPVRLKEQMVVDVLSRGNGYCRIHRPAGAPTTIAALEPLRADKVKPEKDDREGRRGFIRYRHTDDKGRQTMLLAEDVLDFSGFGTDEVGKAPSVLQVAATPFAVERRIGMFTEKMLRMGALFRGLFKLNKKASEAELAKMAKNLSNHFMGTSTSARPPLLPDFMEFVPVNMTASDLQLAQVKELHTHDILRAFGVPAQMLSLAVKNTAPGDLGRVLTSFSRFTIKPLVRRMENELNMKLVPPKSKWRVEIDDAELEKSTFSERVNIMRLALGGSSSSGILTVNEARGWLGFDPVRQDGADEVAIWQYRGKGGNGPAQPAKDDDGDQGDGDKEADAGE